MGIAITVPIVLGIALEHLDIGLALCFGAFWSSPSNTHGSFRNKKLGILFSAALVTIVSFIGGYLNIQLILLLPILGLLTFSIAYISIYGFRASLISFSGLLALVLSFAHTPTGLEPYEYSLLIGLGGLWYLLLVTIAYYLNPKAQTEESLIETFELTAQFLKTRAQLVGEKSNRKELQNTLHKLQTELIEHHETLRDILIVSRKTSGNSKYQNKQLLIFIQLVEILETAIANPVDYDTMDTLFEKNRGLKENFQSIIFEISEQLNVFAISFNKKDISCFNKLEKLLKSTKAKINTIDEKVNYEHFVILQNLLEYQEKQFEKLKRIKWLLSNPTLKSSEFLATKKLKQFLVPQEYDLKMGVQNFTFKSTIFKHSLRLSVVMMTGFLVGTLLQFQNPYWILLTIVVIMRPSYGLTKDRSKDRIIGTVIGAFIAAGIVFFVKDNYILGVLSIITLVIAFMVLQKNYKVSAAFVTLSVVFIYAILRPDIFVVIQYRILDTIIGALLSFMAIKWLWPAWGFLEIRGDIASSVLANQKFFVEIASVYIDKTSVSTNFKVARKTAFLQTSNLNAAFQRMAQEPKSKQKNLDTIYELVVLNHTLLSSLATLSTYLQHHKTTPASNNFKEAVTIIEDNLKYVKQRLEKSSQNIEASTLKLAAPSASEQRLMNFKFSDVKALIQETQDQEKNYHEAHLIWEQLRWLHSISRKMRELSHTL
ncbi:TIGR01666 family membrane protein [Patiriisocius marinistellae]|uniref:TIGR01666 family membrane protein n=1 Tax=Patiriisocius marinistellae TaxID=2494560 RepID=A0A5J4FX31_9FLAO|nr:TIGR01666 family membrane protein [Patiriisocius marinistellae]